MTTIRQDYDRWHARPEYGDDPREEGLNGWVLDLLAGRLGDRLPDLACGRGGFLLRARERGLDVTENGLTVESWHPWNYISASPKVSPS